MTWAKGPIGAGWICEVDVANRVACGVELPRLVQPIVYSVVSQDAVSAFGDRVRPLDPRGLLALVYRCIVRIFRPNPRAGRFGF
jgi:hypothetical protein